MRTVKTKYIEYIIGREEIELLLQENEFKSHLLISIINPADKYEIIKKQIITIENFLNSNNQELIFPFYIGAGKFKKEIFTKDKNESIKKLKKALKSLKNYLKKQNKHNLKDLNSRPIEKTLRDKFFDSLTVDFWDVDSDLLFYKPIDSNKAKEIAKFIYAHKKNVLNQGLKFVIHCSAGVSRSAGVGMALHCCLDFNGNIEHFKKENCKIIFHDRYRPNEFVFEMVCNEYKKLEEILK